MQQAATWQIPMESRWDFPHPETADEHGIVCVGGDLAPGTLLTAYAQGLFPMPIGRRRFQQLAWWSPDPRGVLPIDGLSVSRSLRRSQRRYEIRVNTAFARVVAACADPARSGAWITNEISAAYQTLHQLGYAHSVEAWSLETGELMGGLYGVALGGLFAGESMFHTGTDASKVALVALVAMMRADDANGAGRLIDVQWRTDHLASLGVVAVPRATYLDRLAEALAVPLPAAFARAAAT